LQSRLLPKKGSANSALRVLILTLYSGESDFSDCVDAVANQDYPLKTHEVIRLLPNKEAHDSVYRKIEEERDNYDVFVKLDADMVFLDWGALGRIVSQFQASSDLDHAIFTVRDWLSQKEIFGLHAFSNRVYWQLSDDPLFVDPSPSRPGRKIFFSGPPSPIADHCPNPGLEEAYVVGRHRAMKIPRPKTVWSAQNAATQFRFFLAVASAYREGGYVRRLAALEGANVTLRSGVRCLTNKRATMIHSPSEKELRRREGRILVGWTRGTLRYEIRMTQYLRLPLAIIRVSKLVRRLIGNLWSHRNGTN